MKNIVWIILALSVIACTKKEESSTAEYASSFPSYAIDTIPTQEIEGKTKDTSRKFIRTIELKFRVLDVQKSSSLIEKNISKFDGFVVLSNLQNTVLNSSITPISSDSAIELTEFEVENRIEFRIPNSKIDTMINSVSSVIEHLDFQTNKAEDVSLQFLANRLVQKRVEKLENRVENAVKKNTRDLYKTTVAEENLYYRIEQRDNAIIENLNLKDKVDFSTITMTVYQKPSITKKNIFNIKNVKELKSPFGYRAIESLQTGWMIITEIALFFFKIWTILVLVSMGIILYKYFRLNKS